MSNNVVGIIGATVGIGQYIVNDYVITIAETQGDYGYTMTITKGTDVQTITLYGLTPEQYNSMISYLEQAQAASAAAQTAKDGAEDARDAAQAALNQAITYASNASASASAAAQSAQDASDYDYQAAQARYAAVAAKEAAVAAQSAAEAAQTAAETAASNAGVSATNAAGSATAAQASASSAAASVVELSGVVDEIILTQQTQPTEEHNKVWFDSSMDTEYTVPTYAEHEALETDVTDLKSHFDDVSAFVGDTDTDIGTHIGPVEKLAFTAGTYTQQTVSIKVGSNNSIQVSNTAAALFIRTIQDNISLSAGTYTFSINTAIQSSGYEIQLFNITDNSIIHSFTHTSTNLTKSITLDATKSVRVRIKVDANTVANDTQIVSLTTQGTVDNTLAYATAKLISDVSDLIDDVDDAQAVIGDTDIGSHVVDTELLAFTNGDYTQQSIAIKVRTNNSIRVSGTAAATFLRTIQDNITLPAGTYVFSIDAPIQSNSYEIQLLNIAAGTIAQSITHTSVTITRTVTITETTSFRVRIKIDANAVVDDTQIVSLRTESTINNTLSWVSAELMTKVADLGNEAKQKCKLIKDSGHIFTVDMVSVTGTNVSIKNDKSAIFSETARRITASADGAAVKFGLGDSYTFDTVTVVFYLPYDSYASVSATSCYLWIYANGTSHTPIVSSSNCCWGWNYLKIPRSKLGLGDTTTISSVDIVFKTTTGTTESTFGEIIVDSIILDMKMKPTFILDLDQIWEKSIDNGAYAYCRANNVPYTIHTWQYDRRDTITINEMKTAMLNGCEFSYYGGYTNEGALKNAESFTDAMDECMLMENDIMPYTHKRFVTYGCATHTMTQYLRESLEAYGVKAIRGRWMQNPVGFFSDYSTWLPYSIEISQENSTLQQIKDHIDEAVANGSCAIAFTHGVCNDDESVLGVSSSAIRITTFKGMIDYLVDLRNQGKIQICTMEQFVNQCLG